MSRRTLDQRGSERSARTRASDGGGESAPECTVDEVIARYPGEWIVMRVTGYDQHHLVKRGVLLAHTTSRKEADRIFGEHLARRTADDGPLYRFDAYPRITTGEELRRSIAELVAGPDPVPWPGLR